MTTHALTGNGVDVLPSSPRMGAAFARALVPSRTGEARVPGRAVAMHGHVQDPSRLAQYNRVCGFTLRDQVSPTWLHVLTFPLHVHVLSSRASSIGLAGAVHVSNTITQYRPVLATEQLDITVGAQNLRPHRRGALVDLVGAIEVDGELVWDGVSTYLATGATAPGEVVEAERAPWFPSAPQARWRLAADLGRQYRQVSGDPNPIHTSKLAARAFGFPRPIIHGMWTHARALAALEGRLPDALSTHVDFVKPILLPNTVGFGARPTPAGYEADVTTTDGSKPYLRMRVEAAS
jgi:hypothetical protein